MAKLPPELASLAGKKAVDLTLKETAKLRLSRRRQAHGRVCPEARAEVVKKAIVMLKIRKGVPLTCALLARIGSNTFHAGDRSEQLIGKARVRDILRGCQLHPQGKFSCIDTMKQSFRINDKRIDRALKYYKIEANKINTMIELSMMVVNDETDNGMFDKMPIDEVENDYSELLLKE